MVENMGYHGIQVGEGTLYGKFKGNNKEVIVLIVAGSGPTDMNGNSSVIQGRNDSFIQLATELSKKGISTFRYDKRTAGKSGDTFENKDMDFNLFVDDCRAAIKYVKEEGYQKVIVMGHSQGSLVGMLAATQEEVDGFISVAGAGVPIDITLEKQLLPQLGEASKEMGVIRSLREGDVDISIEEEHPLFSVPNQEFLLTWMKHNPAQIISQLNVPTLLVQGDRDTQVNIEDLKALEEAKKEAQSIVIEGMNHVLKEVENDEENIATYADPSYPLHKELVPSIVEFLNRI